MQISDHIQHLLRDHDCVIIPDFGGLIADYEPARLHPVRHTLAPPAKRIAFNQSLTRNDGLLVDALSQQFGIPTAEARQRVREAVARMQQELAEQQRTELPGIGIFRRAAGQGIEFEYVGSANLLPASFGLPELTSRPVRATDALAARERSHELPAPLLAPARRRGLRRLASGLVTLVLVGMTISANYQIGMKWNTLPAAWRLSFLEPRPAEPSRVPQAANLAGGSFGEVVNNGDEPAAEVATPAPMAAEAAPAAAVAPAKAPVAVAAPKVAPVAAPKKVVAVAAPAAKPVAKPAAPKAVAKVAVKAPVKPAVVAAVKPAATAPTTISGVTNRYYVVVGSFNTWNSAEKARLNLARKGKPAQILNRRRGTLQVRGNNYYRLAVADFTDQAAATKSLPALRKQFGNDMIVYNY